MSKLQMIKRSNGSQSYSSNLPLAMIKDLVWKKGDNISLEIVEVRGRQAIVIFNDGAEENDNGRD